MAFKIISIIDFEKGDSYLAKVTKSKNGRFKLFVTNNFAEAKKFEDVSKIDAFARFIENQFNVQIEIQ